LTLFLVIFFRRGLDLEVAIFFHFGCRWNVLGGVGSRADNRDGLVLGSLSNPVSFCWRDGLMLGSLLNPVSSCWKGGLSGIGGAREDGGLGAQPGNTMCFFGHRMIPPVTSPSVDSPSTPGMSSSSGSYISMYNFIHLNTSIDSTAPTITIRIDKTESNDLSGWSRCYVHRNLPKSYYHY
jgi:hypothetical protein